MQLGRRIAAGIGVLAGLLLAVQSPAAPTVRATLPVKTPFPAPAALAPQVDFWTRVYVEVDTGAGFVHDNRALSVVYETVKVSDHRRTRSRQVKKRKRHWRKVLDRLASGAPVADSDGRRAVELWREALGRAPSPADFKAAGRRLRFQLGQRNRFEAGLVRSGRYEARIRDILREYEVPTDLAFLPHVESSFNAHAYSKVGAAGMWQFTRGTGRRYLRIDGVVDERLEPIKATHAAAKLLRANYSRLGTWPLAITAYNHGVHGMRRAQAGLRTSDIVTIIERYDGRSFGFASRNFYAQFLAARRVARDFRRHFGDLVLDKVEPIRVVRLPFYADSRDVLRHLGIERKVLATLNPSLRDSVLRAHKYIPKDFELRLPAELSVAQVEHLADAIPSQRRFDAQRLPRTHRVRRGDTLGRIARRYGTSIARLVSINNLDSAHRIRVGQKLEITPAGAPARRSSAANRRSEARSAQSVAMREVTFTGDAAGGTSQSTPWRRLDGEWTTVDHQETLAHFARWLALPKQRLRHLNTLPSRALRVGQRIRLDFSRVSAEEFSRRRAAHHHALERQFFAERAVTGTVGHTVKKGENLWQLAREVYGVPVWLLHRHNPEVARGRLMPGMQITVPVLRPVAES